MDHKKSPIRRQKRTSKVLEDNFWDCSVCTYRNTAEAFKCSMCDVRKGTSTRKPRLNSALAAQQAATLPGASTAAASGSATPMPNGSSVGGNQHNNHQHNHHNSGGGTNNNSNQQNTAHSNSHHGNAGASNHGHHHHNHHPKPPKVSRSKAKHKKYPARLTNVDRSTAQTREVTVNSVTVVITEYKPKAAKQPPSRRESSEQSMSESNDSRS